MRDMHIRSIYRAAVCYPVPKIGCIACCATPDPRRARARRYGALTGIPRAALHLRLFSSTRPWVPFFRLRSTSRRHVGQLQVEGYAAGVHGLCGNRLRVRLAHVGKTCLSGYIDHHLQRSARHPDFPSFLITAHVSHPLSIHTHVAMQWFASLLVLGTALAAPTPSLEMRATQQCGQYQSQQSGGYTLSTSGWGWSSGTGSQCSEINSVTSGSIAWDTTWTWSGTATQVKSYTNVQKSFTQKVRTRKARYSDVRYLY